MSESSSRLWALWGTGRPTELWAGGWAAPASSEPSTRPSTAEWPVLHKSTAGRRWGLLHGWLSRLWWAREIGSCAPHPRPRPSVSISVLGATSALRCARVATTASSIAALYAPPTRALTPVRAARRRYRTTAKGRLSHREGERRRRARRRSSVGDQTPKSFALAVVSALLSLPFAARQEISSGHSSGLVCCRCGAEREFVRLHRVPRRTRRSSCHSSSRSTSTVKTLRV